METSRNLAADHKNEPPLVFIAKVLFIGGWLIAVLEVAGFDSSPIKA